MEGRMTPPDGCPARDRVSGGIVGSRPGARPAASRRGGPACPWPAGRRRRGGSPPVDGPVGVRRPRPGRGVPVVRALHAAVSVIQGHHGPPARRCGSARRRPGECTPRCHLSPVSPSSRMSARARARARAPRLLSRPGRAHIAAPRPPGPGQSGPGSRAGRSTIRCPVAWAIAFAMAGATTMFEHSPTPL